MNLRKKIVNDIFSRLDYYDYCKEDFIVDLENDSALVVIKFRAAPEFFFSISETYSTGGSLAALKALNGNTEKKLKITEAPGEYKNIQSKIESTISACIEEIPDWTERIKEELKNRRINLENEVDDFINSFHASIDESIVDKESYFSDQEKSELEEKLDALKERVDQLEKSYGVSEKNSEYVKNQIEKTKNDIEIYPKVVWYKIAGNKIIHALKTAVKNKDIREILIEVTKKFLE